MPFPKVLYPQRAVFILRLTQDLQGVFKFVHIFWLINDRLGRWGGALHFLDTPGMAAAEENIF
jgi:hypothetical protein